MKTLAILSSLCATAAFAAMPQLDKSSVTVRQDGGKSVIMGIEVINTRHDSFYGRSVRHRLKAGTLQ